MAQLEQGKIPVNEVDLYNYYTFEWELEDDPPYTDLTLSQKKTLRDSDGYNTYLLNEAAKRFQHSVTKLIRHDRIQSKT